MILLLGSEGSMGQRYQAILNSLDEDFCTIDLKTGLEDLDNKARLSSGVILATPTDTHFKYLASLVAYKIPILCEKPITKDENLLNLVRSMVKKDGLNLTMMMQYKMLDDPLSIGDSHYNYFRTGNDGLNWDCLQIIGLARGRVDIFNNSPQWICRLNGKLLSIADMDRAYIDSVKKWLKYPGDDIDELVDIHKKVAAFGI